MNNPGRADVGRRVRAGVGLAALVVAGGLATTACSHSGGTAASGAGGHHGGRGVVGTISAENGTTWTVTPARGGAPVTVDITPTTQWGSKAAPATQQSFPVGSRVRVAGSRNGSALSAIRVSAPAAKPAGGSTAPSAAGTTPNPG
ncbi:MAG TPA: DUF5666 domain-containing protein [Pseudonocardia sp.]|jgi:hypothetical protein